MPHEATEKTLGNYGMIFDPSQMVRSLHSPLSLAADVIAVASGGAYVSLSALNYIHGLEGVIAGGLVVVLLAFRVIAVGVHITRNTTEDDAP